MKKKSTDLGLIIPSKIRIAGMTFYKRGNQVVGRVSESNEKRSNTPSQFKQRQKMRHTMALWKMLRFCDTMFTQRQTAYQNFASLANRLPAVYVTKGLMNQASFLMPGIPVSDGTLSTIRQQLGTVDGHPALLTDLKAGEWYRGEKLWLYTAEQCIESNLPRVRFAVREMSRNELADVDENLALVDEVFSDEMKGWALVRIMDNRCSPQTVITRCAMYQQFATDEAFQAAAKSYGGLTESSFLSPGM